MTCSTHASARRPEPQLRSKPRRSQFLSVMDDCRVDQSGEALTSESAQVWATQGSRVLLIFSRPRASQFDPPGYSLSFRHQSAASSPTVNVDSGGEEWRES